MQPKAISEAERTVGARIAALRKFRGVSQVALADALGVSFQQVGKYETGRNRLSSSRLQTIAKFFDVPLSTLFGDDVETVEPSGALAELSIPGAVDLLKAFAAIESEDLRRNVLALTRTAARISPWPLSDNA